jgi:hypothetical protein
MSKPLLALFLSLLTAQGEIIEFNDLDDCKALGFQVQATPQRFFRLVNLGPWKPDGLPSCTWPRPTRPAMICNPERSFMTLQVCDWPPEYHLALEVLETLPSGK